MAAIATIQINVNEKLFLRNPEHTELGRNIVSNSIILIEKIGFENFTFKKLAKEINSTEASIYRYFENKHKLLIYLVSWYWSWMEYQVDFQTNNIEDSEKKLNIAIDILCQTSRFDPEFLHINEDALHRIVVDESSKAYLTKDVDADNKEGFFHGYKSLCRKIAGFVTEIAPDFKYPRALMSTIVEASHHQKFFSEHLPSLTEVSESEGGSGEVSEYLRYLIFKLLKG
ncbi:MAG: TetR/AcrR family transcriptional regulator [Cyclobacteriaceae bacterium]